MQDTARNVELSNVKQTLRKEQRKLFFRRLRSNRLMVTGGVTIILLTLLAIFGPYVVQYTPYEMDVSNRLQPMSSNYWLGTDEFGRDLLSRIAHGAKVTMGVGLSVALISSFIGMVVGLYASYYRTLDHILMRICDGLMAIPGILLAIALMAALGPSTRNVVIALSIVFIPNIARVIRSAAIVVREQTYIEAMKEIGRAHV